MKKLMILALFLPLLANACPMKHHKKQPIEASCDTKKYGVEPCRIALENYFAKLKTNKKDK